MDRSMRGRAVEARVFSDGDTALPLHREVARAEVDVSFPGGWSPLSQRPLVQRQVPALMRSLPDNFRTIPTHPRRTSYP